MHRRVLREAFARHGGYEVDEEGDAFLVAFQAAGEAVAAAREAQQGLASVEWPHEGGLRVRMGVHTGEPLPVPPKYVGMDVHRAARIMAAGHGGQVLVSETTAALLDGVPLRDLGPHRLKDMLRADPALPARGRRLAGRVPAAAVAASDQPAGGCVAAAGARAGTRGDPRPGRGQRTAGDVDRRRRVGEDAAGVAGGGGAVGSVRGRCVLRRVGAVAGDGRGARRRWRRRSGCRPTTTLSPGSGRGGCCWCWTTSSISHACRDGGDRAVGGRDGGAGDLAGAAASQRRAGAAGRAAARARRRSSCSSVERPQPDGESKRTRRSPRSVGASTICRSRSSLPPPGRSCFPRPRCLNASTPRCRSCPAAPVICRTGSRRCARRSSGATTCSTPTPRPPSGGCLSSAAPSRSTRPRQSPGPDLDQIASLLDQSLLKPLGDDRFFLLETLREYAGERLDAGRRDRRVRTPARPLVPGAARGDRASAPSRGAELFAWFRLEEDNLRAMLDQLTAAECYATPRRRSFSAVLDFAQRLESRPASASTPSWVRKVCPITSGRSCS